MHHPPLPTAMADWDGVNLIPAEDRALAEVIARHPQVRAIVGGHLHRVATSTLAGRPVLAGPSTYLQARPNFDTEQVEMYAGAPGFALHAFTTASSPPRSRSSPRPEPRALRLEPLGRPDEAGPPVREIPQCRFLKVARIRSGLPHVSPGVARP